MKKIKFLKLIAPIGLISPIVISASCTSKNDDNKQTVIQNSELKTKMQDIINAYQLASDNYLFNYNKTSGKADLTKVPQGLQKEFNSLINDVILNVVNTASFYGEGYVDYSKVDDINLIDEYTKLIQNFDDSFFNKDKNVNGSFYNVLASLDSLIRDLIAQLKENTKVFKEMLLTNDGSASKSGIKYLYNEAIAKDLSVPDSSFQNAISFDYQLISNKFANLAESQWGHNHEDENNEGGNHHDEEGEAHFHVYNNDSEHAEGHNHSHSTGNMIYELGEFLEKIQSQKFKDKYLKAKENVKDEALLKLLAKFENLFNSEFKNASFKIAYAYKAVANDLINKLKDLATFKNLNLDSIFVAVKLADGSEPK